ncbi:hypothetical protein [Halobacillus sp. H74]|uniref:hypothetical protein n=1 Tax=Halobacillus sp. H74 TaxID=3457436 RepID=UPI003FCD27CB
MGKGLVYNIIMYPAIINLNKGQVFEMKTEEGSYGVLVSRHVNALQILDFNNELEIHEDPNYANNLSSKMSSEVAPIDSHHFVQQIGENSFKVLDFTGTDEVSNSRVFSNEFYTEIILIQESNNIEEDKTSPNYDLLENVLDEFLLLYKDVVKQSDIRKVNDLNDRDMILSKAVRAYTDDEKDKTFSEVLDGYHEMRPLPIGIKATPKVSDVFLNEESTEEISRIINHRIEENDFVDDTSAMIGKAAEELYVRNNYKYAFLDVFFAVESFIMQKVWDYKKKALELSNTKLKNHKKNLTISYLLDVEIFLIINSFNEAEKDLIEKIKGLSSKRNKIVHEKENVDRKETEEALINSEEFIKLINNKFSEIL